MTKIAFLGLGAMGQRMAARLLSAGHDLTVWNRSPDVAAALVSHGAKLAKDPAEAVKDAEIVFSMVRDDTASSDVWLSPETGALNALPEGTIAVECSTVSHGHIKKLSDAFDAAGRKLVDAPLAGSRPQAEQGQLIFLVGGETANVEALGPLFSIMGSATHHVGGTGAGSIVKLMVNGLFGVQLAVAAELLGFAKASGIDVAGASEAIGATPVCSPAVKLAMGAMQAGGFAPMFPIDLVEKDFGLLTQDGETLEAALPLSAATRAVYARAKEQGFAGDNITGVAQLYL